MHILVVNGPNMNMLGIRQPEIYGHETYEDLKALIRAEADRLGASVSFFQSNHEGALVGRHPAGILRPCGRHHHQPGAYTHTSVALLDAVKAVGTPRWRSTSPTRQPGGVPPCLLHPGRLRGHHPGAMGSRDMWRPCGFSAARTLDKRRSLTDNMPIPHWVSREVSA